MSSRTVVNPETETTYLIRDNAPDPTGQGRAGMESSVQMGKNAIGFPLVRYEGRYGKFILEVDVHAEYVPVARPQVEAFVGGEFQPVSLVEDEAPAEPELVRKLYLLLYCPRCRNALRVHSDHKAMEFEPEPHMETGRDGKPFPVMRGKLSVERIQCTWELEGDRRKHFGLNMCNWTVAIDNNRAYDAD